MHCNCSRRLLTPTHQHAANSCSMTIYISKTRFTVSGRTTVIVWRVSGCIDNFCDFAAVKLPMTFIKSVIHNANDHTVTVCPSRICILCFYQTQCRLIFELLKFFNRTSQPAFCRGASCRSRRSRWYYRRHRCLWLRRQSWCRCTWQAWRSWFSRCWRLRCTRDI